MKSVPKPKKSKTKSLKEKCVALAIKIAKHGKGCVAEPQYCHNGFMSRLIDGAHIVGQAQSARTAARTDNIVPLCRECHTFYTAHPNEWKVFIDLLHPGRRQMLEAVARVQGNIDWEKIYRGLQDEWKVIE